MRGRGVRAGAISRGGRRGSYDLVRTGSVESEMGFGRTRTARRLGLWSGGFGGFEFLDTEDEGLLAMMNAASTTMPDIQASVDTRNVKIDKVGVKNIRHPLTLKTMDGGEQTTVAEVNMYVALPHDQKGTHMSRFMEILAEHNDALTPEDISTIAREVRERLNAEEAHIEMTFPYFTKKAAPVTGVEGLIDHEVAFHAVSTPSSDEMTLKVKIAATSLCPCSKEISAYGAHNQRCEITARVWFDGGLWIEELVEMLEGAASCSVYPILKRADEKFVTEAAFDNPKFVEDSIRDLAVALEHDERIVRFHIASENFESIHNHNAYAEIERDKRDG